MDLRPYDAIDGEASMATCALYDPILSRAEILARYQEQEDARVSYDFASPV